MNLPFYKFGQIGPDASLLIAFLIGTAFGFFLERGGLGNARTLAAQFYFTDMRVFKIMFTAILTAMAGVYFLAWIGYLNLGLIDMTDTYLLPQIAGGLIFGFGFIIGGYCPGTGYVAAVTGRIDSLFYMLGILSGTFIFDIIFPFIREFFYSSSMGKIKIYEFFKISPAIVIAIIFVMAIIGFIAAEKIEKSFQAKKPGL